MSIAALNIVCKREATREHLAGQRAIKALVKIREAFASDTRLDSPSLYEHELSICIRRRNLLHAVESIMSDIDTPG